MIPFMMELYEEFPVSSRISLRGSEKVSEVVERVSKPPLFSDGWLIECTSKTKASFLKKLEVCGDNKIVISVHGRDAIQEKLQELSAMEPLVVDNHLVSKSDTILWIIEQLKCSSNIAIKIYNRAGKRTSNIVSGVQRLQMLPCVTDSDVSKYVDKTRTISIEDVVQFILGVSRRGVSKDAALGLVYDFRYAQKWLLGEISKQLALYLRVLNLARTNEMTLKNFTAYLEITNDTELQKISPFRIKKILECFGVVSIEYVFYVKSVIDSVSRTDMLGLVKLINLIKLGGRE